MSNKQRRGFQSPARDKTAIPWRGRSYSIGEACVLAFQEQSLGNLQAAADIYELVLARAPDSAEVHNNRGALLQQMHRYDEALACYGRAIKLKPGYANAHYNQGTVLKRMNRYRDALASFDKALALKPDHAEACNNSGLIFVTIGNMPEAEKMFLRASALRPDFPDPLFNLVTIRKYQEPGKRRGKKHPPTA